MFVTRYASTTSLLDLKKRTLRPSVSVRKPTRSPFFVTGFHSITFDRSIELSFSTILSRPTLWAQCAGHFTSNYGFYFLLSWLPLYLTKVRGFSIAEMASIAALTFAVQGVSALVSGWTSDRIIARGASAPVVRKAMMVVGHVVAATGTLAIVLVETRGATIAWLLVTGAAMGINSVGVYLIGQTFAGPRAAGRWIGMQNFVGNFSGIIGPIVTGMMIDASGGYLGAFALAAGISAAGAICWGLVLPRIEPIDWDRVRR